VDTMTLPRFLDCSFTLLFDEYQRLGHDISTATEKLADWMPGKPEQAQVVKIETQASKNDQALTQLQQMMMGVKKS
jgi:hypothetical protein